MTKGCRGMAMSANAKRIGYIGLGAMGGAMARNLLKADFPVHVFDADVNRIESVRQLGARGETSPAQVAAHSDIVFSSLPGSNEVIDVYLGERGVIEGARAGLIAVDMSTVPPTVALQIAESLEGIDVGFLDAPVARTREAAIAGTLAIMVGGPESVFSEACPILNIMGSTIVHVGENGAGQVAKLLNNAILMSNIVTACEALLVGARAGVDVTKLVEV